MNRPNRTVPAAARSLPLHRLLSHRRRGYQNGDIPHFESRPAPFPAGKRQSACPRNEECPHFAARRAAPGKAKARRPREASGLLQKGWLAGRQSGKEI